MLTILAVLALGGGGCASNYASGPAFVPVAPAEGKALVYFLRQKQTGRNSIPIMLSIPASANNCVEMDSGGYYSYLSEPGELKVAGVAATVKLPRVSLALDVKPGETHYVYVEYDDHVPKMREMAKVEAEGFLAETKQISVCKR